MGVRMSANEVSHRVRRSALLSAAISSCLTMGAHAAQPSSPAASTTTEPLEEGMEVSGPMTFTVYLSSDRKDTDVTVKVIDVYPDGTAYNLDETIQRVRYREGYDKPPKMMEPGKVYKVALQPMTTSNYFPAGHRIRIEVSSSNFPRFDRNLNTGGNNYDETKGLVAHNTIHHSKEYPSELQLTVVKHPGAPTP